MKRLKHLILPAISIILLAAVLQSPSIKDYYEKNKGNDLLSKSTGKVSSGALVNAKLIPFSGSNFSYFDTTSYLEGRAFLNDKVLKTILASYKDLSNIFPERKFKVMECSHKEGGLMLPHRTHQNGLSVDFMMPLIKNNKPYYNLDHTGGAHYMLTFNNQGEYSQDKSVKIDFEVVAKQILSLNKKAHDHGMKIKKVIIKIELKDELFSGKYGKELKNSGIYVVKGLTPLINSLHDDHFHIDFTPK